MKPDDYVFETLSSSGLPGTKIGWPEGGAPSLPWFTYKRHKGGEVYADDTIYHRMRRYDVGLYQREIDDDERDAFEEAILKIGPFTSDEVWIPSESCWVTKYSFTYHEPTE